MERADDGIMDDKAVAALNGEKRGKIAKRDSATRKGRKSLVAEARNVYQSPYENGEGKGIVCVEL